MYKIFGITDKGLVYKHNEDCFMINENVYFDKACINIKLHDVILAVADGVGGENAGEIASKICLEKLGSMDINLGLGEIKNYIQNISRYISEYALNNPKFSGMATTLAGAICLKNRLIVFNVGNSRVYRYRNGNLRKFTVDDTLVQSMFNFGQIKGEDIGNHPNKNIILQAIGREKKNVSLDVHLHDARNPLKTGDVLLFCTDGLTDFVGDYQIQGIVSGNTEIEKMAEQLVVGAKDAKSDDNITVLLLKMY